MKKNIIDLSVLMLINIVSYWLALFIAPFFLLFPLMVISSMPIFAIMIRYLSLKENRAFVLYHSACKSEWDDIFKNGFGSPTQEAMGLLDGGGFQQGANVVSFGLASHGVFHDMKVFQSEVNAHIADTEVEEVLTYRFLFNYSDFVRVAETQAVYVNQIGTIIYLGQGLEATVDRNTVNELVRTGNYEKCNSFGTTIPIGVLKMIAFEGANRALNVVEIWNGMKTSLQLTKG